MKVLSYLEWMSNFNKQEANRYQYKLRDKYGFTSVVDFYAQPFKPELIAELFENIECYAFIWNIKGYEIFGLSGEHYEDVTSVYQQIFPRTLDDFINDATRAGIELEWRGEK